VQLAVLLPHAAAALLLRAARSTCADGHTLGHSLRGVGRLRHIVVGHARSCACQLLLVAVVAAALASSLALLPAPCRICSIACVCMVLLALTPIRWHVCGITRSASSSSRRRCERHSVLPLARIPVRIAPGPLVLALGVCPAAGAAASSSCSSCRWPLAAGCLCCGGLHDLGHLLLL
jgi:hypothetical protein